MGTDLRGEDMTKAARRAVHDALHRNSLTMADALGFPKDQMIVEITVGVPKPDEVDAAAVLGESPYGRRLVRAVKGGLSIPSEDGTRNTIMASAAVEVFFDVERG